MGVNYNTRIVTDGLVLCLDAANPKSLSQNVHPNPTDIYSWLNLPYGNNCALSRDTIPSPVGNTPLKMVVTGNDPSVLSYNSSVWNLAPAVSGQTWTVSAWVKASAATTAQLFIFEALDNGGYVQAPAGTTSIGTNWQRISFSYTFVNALTTNVQVRLDGPDTGGAGVIIWWDGLQVERSAVATAFNAKPNINRAQWTGVGANRYNVTFYNSPQFDTSVVTFNGSTQYAAIPNSTLLDNQQFTVSVWVKTNATTQNGFWFEKGTVNSQYALFQEGAYIKCRVNNGTLVDTIAPVTATYMNTTNWYNVVFTFTSGSQVCYINGSVVGTGSTLGPLSTSAGGMSIGAYGGYTGSHAYYYNGSISVVKVYNRVLSATEVYQNFNALRGRYGV